MSAWTTITENQKRSFVAQAMDASRVTADKLRTLSDAEQFAVLATITAAIGCAQDTVFLTSATSDCLEAAAILDGVLARHPSETWAWHVGSGCFAHIQLLPEEQHALDLA